MNVDVRTVTYRDGSVVRDVTQRIRAESQWDALRIASAGKYTGDADPIAGDVILVGRCPISGVVEWEVAARNAENVESETRLLREEHVTLRPDPAPVYEPGDLVVTRTGAGGREEVLRVHQRLADVKDGRPGFIGAPVGVQHVAAWAYDSQITETYRQRVP